MKKFLVFVIASGFLLSSCSIYTCPTYAKKAPPQVKANKVAHV